MREKYDLKQMLKEIKKEDLEYGQKKKKMSQSDIQNMIAKKRKGAKK